MQAEGAELLCEDGTLKAKCPLCTGGSLLQRLVFPKRLLLPYVWPPSAVLFSPPRLLVLSKVSGLWALMDGNLSPPFTIREEWLPRENRKAAVSADSTPRHTQASSREARITPRGECGQAGRAWRRRPERPLPKRRLQRGVELQPRT